MSELTRQSYPGDIVNEAGCRTCAECKGNAVDSDGYPCPDCEGTGCGEHPFCWGDHDE